MSWLGRSKGEQRAIRNQGRFFHVEMLESRMLLAADIFEPNDRFEAAFDLGQGDQYYSGLSIHESGNDDWYGWTASQTGTLRVAVLFEDDLGDVDLELYDGGQTRIAMSDSVSDDEQLTYAVTAGQKYVIRVFGFRGDTQENYNLEIDGPGSVRTSSQPPLSPNLGVSTGPSSPITGSTNSVFSSPNSGSGSVNGGSSVINQFIGSGRLFGQFAPRRAANPDLDGRPSDTGISAADEDVFEPNDSVDAATNFGTSDQMLSGLTIHDGVDADWYRWTAPRDGMLSVAILFDNTKGDLDLELQDSSLTRLALSDSVTDNEQIVREVVGGQTYLVHVYRFSGADPVSYRLWLSGAGLSPELGQFIDASLGAAAAGQNVGSSNSFTGGSQGQGSSSPVGPDSNRGQVGNGPSASGNGVQSGNQSSNPNDPLEDETDHSSENETGGSGAQVINLTSGRVDPASAQLPRAYVNTSYAAPQGGTTWRVNAGDNLQGALDAAQPGDIIEIAAGATFVGKFELPKKQGNEWIYIRSSRHAELPPEGTRVTPAQAYLMPRLVAMDFEGWVVSAALGAGHYRFVGIEITKPAGNSFTAQLVQLGSDRWGTTAASVDELPHDIIFDRTYIHGTPWDSTLEGIRVDGKNIAIVDSYISDIHAVGNGDTQAILGINGAGPIKVVNNYLEAAGENIMFGGADPRITVSNGGIQPSHPAVNCAAASNGSSSAACGLVPSDIEIRGNHIVKPPSWNPNDPRFARTAWSAKNLFELKNAQRVLVEGNVFENSWSSAQTGWGIVMTPRNQQGTAPWSTVQDVTFSKNIVKNTENGLNILPMDNQPGRRSDNVKRISIRDNLFVGIRGRVFEIATSAAPNFTPARDILIEHNTVLHDGVGDSYLVLGDSTTVTVNFAFRNNLTTSGSYGLVGSLDRYLINYDVRNNAVIPSDGISGIGFVNYTSGDFRLASTSPYKSAGTDGRDLGADMNALLAATGKSIRG